MKRFASILILTIMLFNGAGFYIFYFQRLHEVKDQMRKAMKLLPEEKLEKILVPSFAFAQALVGEDEMRWNGRMYDIAKIEKQPDHVMVYCLRDHKEEDLIGIITGIFSEPLNVSEVPLAVVQFLGLTFLLPEAGHAISAGAMKNIPSSHFVLYFPETCASICTPPPEAIV